MNNELTLTGLCDMELNGYVLVWNYMEMDVNIGGLLAVERSLGRFWGWRENSLELAKWQTEQE